MVDFGTIVNLAWLFLFVGGAGLGTAYALSYNHVKIGRVEFRLRDRGFGGLVYLFLGPAVVVAAAGISIVRAQNGEWQQGDWRGSQFFVDLCWLAILVLAPLSALWGASLLARSAWHGLHDRGGMEDSGGVAGQEFASAESAPEPVAKKHEKHKKRDKHKRVKRAKSED